MKNISVEKKNVTAKFSCSVKPKFQLFGGNGCQFIRYCYLNFLVFVKSPDRVKNIGYVLSASVSILLILEKFYAYNFGKVSTE